MRLNVFHGTEARWKQPKGITSSPKLYTPSPSSPASPSVNALSCFSVSEKEKWLEASPGDSTHTKGCQMASGCTCCTCQDFYWSSGNLHNALEKWSHWSMVMKYIDMLNKKNCKSHSSVCVFQVWQAGNTQTEEWQYIFFHLYLLVYLLLLDIIHLYILYIYTLEKVPELLLLPHLHVSVRRWDRFTVLVKTYFSVCC